MSSGGVAIPPRPYDAMSNPHLRAPSHALLSVPPPPQTPSPAQEPETINTFAVLAVVLIYNKARDDWERDKGNLTKYEALTEATELVLDLVQNYAQLDIEAIDLLSDSLEPFL